MIKIQDLTPSAIVGMIRDNPGKIQKATYPNPGEPKLDEKAFMIEESWIFMCLSTGCDYQGSSPCSCDSDDAIWSYQPTESFPYPIESPEFEIAGSLMVSCSYRDRDGEYVYVFEAG